MEYFIAVVSRPNYFVSPEKQWAKVFFLHLPTWIVATIPESEEVVLRRNALPRGNPLARLGDAVVIG